MKLPIIIHNREATQDCIDILLEEHAEEVGGIMHSFSGSPEIADIVTNKLNFYISLGGPVTFKMLNSLKKLLSMCQWSDCLLKPMHRIFRHIHIEESEMNRRE